MAVDRFTGRVDFLGGQAEASASTEASVDEQLILEPGFINVGAQDAITNVFGDAEIRVVHPPERIRFGVHLGPGRRHHVAARPQRSAARDRRRRTVTCSEATASSVRPATWRSRLESEAEAEAVAEIGFNAAAAAAAAVGVQAENGFLPTSADVASATSTSTSVFDRAPDVVNQRDLPGPSPEGDRGGFPSPSLDADDLVFEVETESRANAEVGFGAGAAAAAAAAGGKPDIQADSAVGTTPFAAAAAAASGAIVFVEVTLPPEGEAGMVRATARAEDPDCNGVSVAVSVAGVPDRVRAGTTRRCREAGRRCAWRSWWWRCSPIRPMPTSRCW